MGGWKDLFEKVVFGWLNGNCVAAMDVRILVLCLTVFVAAAQARRCSADSSEVMRGIAEDRIIVKFRKDAVLAALGDRDRVPPDLPRTWLRLPEGTAIEEPAIIGLDRQARHGQKKGMASDLAHFFYIRLPRGLSPQQAAAALKGHPWVEYAEPDHVGTIAGAPADPSYSSQWHLGSFTSRTDNIRSLEAWAICTGSAHVVVAVLDTGCDTNTLELAGRLVPGYNFIATNNMPADDNGHGTAVATVLAANANNGYRGAGVNWGCRIMPVKVMDKTGAGFYSQWAQGVDWAVSNGAKVINLSGGGSSDDLTLSNAINRAVAAGVIFITITHNYGAPSPTFPGRHPRAITVGATGTNGWLCGFSNYGTNTAIVAPGTNILTTGTGGVWQSWYGTSVAAPQVAGVAALLCTLRPGLNAEQARALLCGGADDRVSADPNDTPGLDLHYGWGRLNAYNSLRLAMSEIDSIAVGGTNAVLTWQCPLNASNKHPYVVEYAADLMAPAWTSATNVQYASNVAAWVGSGSPPTRFYRVGIRAFPAR